MKKIISAMLALLMLATAAAANPGPPPRHPRPGPVKGPAPRPMPPRPGPAKGPAPRPMPPRPGPGVHRPPAHHPPRPMPPRPGVRPGGPPPRPMPPRPGYRVPPPPPPRYHHHRYSHWRDDWFIGGLGIGLVIAALANSGNDYSAEQRDYERRAEEVRRAARDTAERQSRHLTEIIGRIGSQPALYELNEYWQAQGQTTLLDTSDPVRSLKVSGFQENLTIVYWIDRARNDTIVTVTAPAYDVSESVTARYAEPAGNLAAVQPAPPLALAQPAAARPIAPAQRAAAYDTTAAFKHLGFTLDENARTPQGYLIILSVIPATAAAYTGVKKDATLYKIDGNSTAQVSVEQLCAFIDRRAAAEAVVKITFSEGGKEKSVNLQL